MIWGKTYEQKVVTRNWFAWHPVRLKNGRWVWFETIRKYWGAEGWRYVQLRDNREIL